MILHPIEKPDRKKTFSLRSGFANQCLSRRTGNEKLLEELGGLRCHVDATERRLFQQERVACWPSLSELFYPTISNGMTLHSLLLGGSGGVGAVSGRAVSMKLPILSAAWSCIWLVT